MGAWTPEHPSSGVQALPRALFGMKVESSHLQEGPISTFVPPHAFLERFAKISKIRNFYDFFEVATPPKPLKIHFWTKIDPLLIRFRTHFSTSGGRISLFRIFSAIRRYIVDAEFSALSNGDTLKFFHRWDHAVLKKILKTRNKPVPSSIRKVMLKRKASPFGISNIWRPNPALDKSDKTRPYFDSANVGKRWSSSWVEPYCRRPRPTAYVI